MNKYIGCWLVLFCLISVESFAKIPVTKDKKIRLVENWQFLKGDVGNVWELVRPVRKGQPECQPIWTSVTLPHCFNAEDGVDLQCRRWG